MLDVCAAISPSCSFSYIFNFSYQLLEELHEKQQQEIKLQEEMEALKDTLRSEKQKLEQVTSNHDTLRNLCDEKDAAIRVRSLYLKIFQTAT